MLACVGCNARKADRTIKEAGLRLLRQDPWECLASFICSSTKQVVQIQEMVALLSGRLGDPVAVPPGHRVEHAFPSPAQVAGAGEKARSQTTPGMAFSSR